MNKYTIHSLLAFMCLLLTVVSCSTGNSNEDKSLELQRMNDSLQLVSNRNEMKVQEMNSYFDSIANCLDSIMVYENMLIPVVNPETNRHYSKIDIRQRLNQLGELIASHKAKIASLSEALSWGNDSVSYAGILTTIKHLRTQLEEKENRLAAVTKQLQRERQNLRKNNQTSLQK